MNYELILDGMNYSYSAINTFDTCKLSFKMTYIDAEERIGNAFSDFGNFIHSILEKYFKDELDIFNLSAYYKKNYKKNILHSFPIFPPNMDEKYYQQGLDFFDNFEFDKSKYDIIHIEEKIETVYKDFKFVFIPDLVLKEKDTGKYVLFDYKTANLFSKEKSIKKKITEIKKQVHLYSYFLWYTKQIEISKIVIWAIRNREFIEIDYDQFYGFESLQWLETTVKNVKEEKEWDYDNSQTYYCENICSCRRSCPYVNLGGF